MDIYLIIICLFPITISLYHERLQHDMNNIILYILIYTYIYLYIYIYIYIYNIYIYIYILMNEYYSKEAGLTV